MGAKTPLIISVTLAIFAGIISFSAVKKAAADARKGFNPKPVVVAAVDISEGTTITLEMLATRGMPEQFVTASIISPDSASYVVGQKVLVPLQAGDALLWSQFETTRAAEHLSNKVMERMRVMSIDAKATAAVAGHLRPNDHVDIIGTFKNPTTGELNSLTLLQNVVIMATGKVTGTTNINLLSESQRGYTDVSVLVIPEEAEVLTLAQEMGSLTLTLRNSEDPSSIATRAFTNVNTLFNQERIQAFMEARKNFYPVVMKGTRGGGQ